MAVGFVGGAWDGRVVAVERLREWRGVKPVAGPSGVSIATRLRTTAEDEFVLDAVADHVGRLRRADLAARGAARSRSRLVWTRMRDGGCGASA